MKVKRVMRVVCHDEQVEPESVISTASRMFLNTDFQHFWLNLRCINCRLNALKCQHLYEDYCRCEIFALF